MSYTNPFPALKEYMRRMREISDDRYEDGYESTSSNEDGGNTPPRSGRAQRQSDDGSDSEDDYYPVNPYLERARAAASTNSHGDSAGMDSTIRIGVLKTPKKGLACPTCRTQPIVDATGSCLVTSMVELVQKVSGVEIAQGFASMLTTIPSIGRNWRDQRPRLPKHKSSTREVTNLAYVHVVLIARA